MLLLLVFSCTEAIWYPHPPDIDTAAGGGDTAADTGGGGSVPCSPAVASPAATLQISNTDVTPSVSIYWRDSSCTETRYHQIEPGNTVSQPTYEGHIWVARDAAGAYLDHLATPSGSGTWEIAR